MLYVLGMAGCVCIKESLNPFLYATNAHYNCDVFILLTRVTNMLNLTNLPLIQVVELIAFNISSTDDVAVELLLAAEELDEVVSELEVTWVHDMTTEELLKLIEDKCKEYAS